MGTYITVSTNSVGAITSIGSAVAPNASVEPLTNAAAAAAPVSAAQTQTPQTPTGSAAAARSALTAQINDTNYSSGFAPIGAKGWLAQSYAAVALFAAPLMLVPVYWNPSRPAIAPVEPLGRTNALRRIDTSS